MSDGRSVYRESQPAPSKVVGTSTEIVSGQQREPYENRRPKSLLELLLDRRANHSAKPAVVTVKPSEAPVVIKSAATPSNPPAVVNKRPTTTTVVQSTPASRADRPNVLPVVAKDEKKPSTPSSTQDLAPGATKVLRERVVKETIYQQRPDGRYVVVSEKDFEKGVQHSMPVQQVSPSAQKPQTVVAAPASPAPRKGLLNYLFEGRHARTQGAVVYTKNRAVVTKPIAQTYAKSMPSSTKRTAVRHVVAKPKTPTTTIKESPSATNVKTAKPSKSTWQEINRVGAPTEPKETNEVDPGSIQLQPIEP